LIIHRIGPITKKEELWESVSARRLLTIAIRLSHLHTATALIHLLRSLAYGAAAGA